MTESEIHDFIAGRGAFLRFLKEWEFAWDTVKLSSLVEEAGGAHQVAIVCADVTNEFIRTGRLASPRVAGIVPPIVELMRVAYAEGVRNFVLPQDVHPLNAHQFAAYGPHALPGTYETETVDELKELPFSKLFTVIPKNSLNPGIDTMFPSWLDEHPELRLFIVIGDVTDLCVYQIAMYLRLRANQYGLDYEVVVPANCVETFETEFDTARELKVLPHDADLMHLLFLYHMALNGIKVVREVH